MARSRGAGLQAGGVLLLMGVEAFVYGFSFPYFSWRRASPDHARPGHELSNLNTPITLVIILRENK
jgi:hypothetical protein